MRSGDVLLVLLVLLGLIALYTLIGCAAPNDHPQPDNAQPLDPKTKPTLETATLYVAGSNGGAYKISWFVWTPKGSVLHQFRGTGVIKDKPTAYSINLEGFRSDRDTFFLGKDDIIIEGTKTEPWKGELVIVLKVNDTLVECDTMRDNSPRDYPGEVYITFNADVRKDYKKMAACANRLES